MKQYRSSYRFLTMTMTFALMLLITSGNTRGSLAMERNLLTNEQLLQFVNSRTWVTVEGGASTDGPSLMGDQDETTNMPTSMTSTNNMVETVAPTEHNSMGDTMFPVQDDESNNQDTTIPTTNNVPTIDATATMSVLDELQATTSTTTTTIAPTEDATMIGSMDDTDDTSTFTSTIASSTPVPTLVDTESDTESSTPDIDVDVGMDDTPITCGGRTCGSGEYCCNSSCGICAPFGSSCIQGFCQPCGPVTCQLGDVCCNSSCGICTPPRDSCTQEECGGENDLFLRRRLPLLKQTAFHED